MRRPTNKKVGKGKDQKHGPARGTQKTRNNDKIDPGKIIRYGKVVYDVFWDSGSPGAGAEHEYVYRWRDWYAVSYSEGDIKGPYKSFSAAIKATELNAVTEATVSITSSELKAEKIARMLRSKTDPPLTLRINDEIWDLSEVGKFVRDNTEDNLN